MLNAKLYSTANGMQRRDAEEVIAEFSNKLKWTHGARILDIGCGNGEVTAAILLPQLPPGFKQIIGLDVSQEMIQYARKVYSHPKVFFVQFDIANEAEDILEELDRKIKTSKNNNIEISGQTQEKKTIFSENRLRDNTDEKHGFQGGYDIILSFYCLHWIHNQRLALTNIYKLLKPGGDALLVLLAKSPIFSLYDILSKLPAWKEYMQDVDNFISPYHRSENPLDDFTDLLSKVGFDAVKLECRERHYTFQTTANLTSAIIAVNPFVSRIPNHLRGQFISDCLKQVEGFKLSELINNTHVVRYKLLVAHIRKSL